MAKNISSVTGLPNRLELDSTLKQAIEHDEGLALALLDIDSFLEINTDFGQETGDQLLRALGTLLTEQGYDGCYHVAGDEFAIMLRSTSLEQAFLRMEALRTRVEQSSGGWKLPDGRPITITIGVAQHPRDAKDARGLWDAAGAALYAAKEGGRNQVALPPSEEMVMKSCYYPASSLRKLKLLAERLRRKESQLLREALSDLFHKYKDETSREA
jgi:diguanylate cyclase (GGDEF)-like protein